MVLGRTKDIAPVPRSLPSLVLLDLALISQILLGAISVGLVGLIQGAGVGKPFLTAMGGTAKPGRTFWLRECAIWDLAFSREFRWEAVCLVLLLTLVPGLYPAGRSCWSVPWSFCQYWYLVAF